MSANHPELAELRTYNPAGVAIDVVTAGPASSSTASFVRIGPTKMFLSYLELVMANGNTRGFLVWPGWEAWLEYVEITDSTTSDTVVVGWE